MIIQLEKIERIKKRFPKEWVLLSNYKLDRFNRLTKGRVIAHSKKREDIYKELMKRKEDVAVDYTGSIPKDLAVMF